MGHDCSGSIEVEDHAVADREGDHREEKVHDGHHAPPVALGPPLVLLEQQLGLLVDVAEVASRLRRAVRRVDWRDRGSEGLLLRVSAVLAMLDHLLLVEALL